MRFLLAAIILAGSLAGSATSASAQASSVEVSATIVGVSPSPDYMMGGSGLHASSMTPAATDAMRKMPGVISSMRTEAVSAMKSSEVESTRTAGQLEVITTSSGSRFKRVDPVPATEAHKGDIVITYTIAANA